MSWIFPLLQGVWLYTHRGKDIVRVGFKRKHSKCKRKRLQLHNVKLSSANAWKLVIYMDQAANAATKKLPSLARLFIRYTQDYPFLWLSCRKWQWWNNWNRNCIWWHNLMNMSRWCVKLPHETADSFLISRYDIKEVAVLSTSPPLTIQRCTHH